MKFLTESFNNTICGIEELYMMCFKKEYGIFYLQLNHKEIRILSDGTVTQ